MSINLTVGTNFDIRQLEFFIECNQKYDQVKITNVYGSIRTNYLNLSSVRPNFRLGNADRKDFEKYVLLARENNIRVDYTVNSLLHMPIEELYDKQEELINNLKYLESVGVERIISSNPLIMEIVSDNTSLKLKCSTILGINRVNAIKHYSKYRVDSICPDIYINRNLPLLSEMQKECDKYGIKIELLANEVCMFGDVPCSNVMRSNCYIHSSLGGNSSQRFNGWPFARCQEARKNNPSSILKIPFILPIHLEKYYQNTGISNFKISGRTNTFEYLTSTVEKYMSQTFSGNLENLFMLPQNVLESSKNGITVEQLIKCGYFNKMLSTSKGCDYHCHECKYCDELYEKLNV